jgi:2-(1,2-epoxy-1,2-dihydrophenyl)acetyl-CoA isomerase
LAAGPTLAYDSVKQAVAFAASHALAETLEFEGAMIRRTGESADHRRAVRSFLEKQEPTFEGR